MNIGLTIKNLRNQKNVSQKELADKLNVSCQSISKWENNNTYPDISMIPIIADYFHVSIDTIFNGVIESADDVIPGAMKNNLTENNKGWNLAQKNGWTGTILPEYGPYAPNEEKLHLFDNIEGKSVLEIACGDGRSLLYLAGKGAKELYGLDISEKQIEAANDNLKSNKVKATLFSSPMEVNPGIPFLHFDCVYSIYGIGWAQDLHKVFGLISKYLKTKGRFIFSWDNPMLPCIKENGGQYLIAESYVKEQERQWTKFGEPLTSRNWKLSSYINALISSGFEIERVIEESDDYSDSAPITGKYYSEHKASIINQTVIIKARKK
ncbi:helix-turn-helix domain-containing protein [Clostridium sp. C2-6-12]|uniref:helix-turn-helix domain-containing protein n=1 Tax=Clostridium sp. C2-6-12 TaxID=2698832 RepID=UPI001370B33D|nr:helix-turn-helix domain-containing protein [Clostridium sp. C2-6-12]